MQLMLCGGEVGGGRRRGKGRREEGGEVKRRTTEAARWRGRKGAVLWAGEEAVVC
jgi:hypothetical protein